MSEAEKMNDVKLATSFMETVYCVGAIEALDSVGQVPAEALEDLIRRVFEQDLAADDGSKFKAIAAKVQECIKYNAYSAKGAWSDRLSGVTGRIAVEAKSRTAGDVLKAIREQME
jgi:hypothetical protein